VKAYNALAESHAALAAEHERAVAENTRLRVELEAANAARISAVANEKQWHDAAERTVAENTRQETNTRLSGEVERLRAKLGLIEDSDWPGKVRALEALNTPLREERDRLRDALHGLKNESGRYVREAQALATAAKDIEPLQRQALLVLELARGSPALGRGFIEKPAVTGTTSDSAPRRLIGFDKLEWL
jgi:hypothetical protein